MPELFPASFYQLQGTYRLDVFLLMDDGFVDRAFQIGRC